jgi:hypothetical protein
VKLPSHKRFIADIESGKAKDLKPQSRFRFACQCCGECCRRDVDIILNPYDIFRATRYLKITTTKFFSRYATQYIGPDSGIPPMKVSDFVLIKQGESHLARIIGSGKRAIVFWMMGNYGELRYDLHKHGKYKITASYKSDADGTRAGLKAKAWTGKVISNTIEIEIKK